MAITQVNLLASTHSL